MSKLLPGIIGCTGAVVVASENSSPEAALVLKLRTQAGKEVLLPISEKGARQVQTVIAAFSHSRDLLLLRIRRPSQQRFNRGGGQNPTIAAIGPLVRSAT